MASYLSPNYVPQFGSYIPQIDPNSYAQTQQVYRQSILQKQSQYQEGIARVQGVLDNVAGLKVGREIDKEYLNNKISQLQPNVQQLAGSDFSQANVVNQAAGYASTLYSDPRIQKDVISAQNYSDAVQQMETARKDGKSSASNDNAVTRNIRAWQMGGAEADLGKQNYTPYYNYTKAWQDYMSGKHANTVYWESDGSGRSDRGIAYTLNQGKKTYIDPATVQRDFETFLQMDAQAAGQVQIDSLYYSDRTPNDVAFQSLRNNAQSALNSYDVSIQQLQQQKVINNTPQDLAQIDDQIEAINNAKSKLSLRLNNGDLEREFLQDPERGKMNQFMTGLTVGAGNRYAYSEIENKTVKNPVFEADIDAQKLGIAKAHLSLQVATEKRLQAKDDRELAKELRDSQGISGPGGAILIGTDGFNSKESTPEQIISDIESQGDLARQQQLKMLFATGQYEGLVRQGQNSNGTVLYTVAPGKEKDFIRAFQDTQDSFQKNPDGADPNVRKYFESENNPNYGLGLLRTYTASKKQVANIQDKLAQRFPDYVPNLDKLGNLNQVLLNENGENITRGDLVNYLNNTDTKNVGTNISSVAKALNISESKAAILQRAVSGFSGTNIYGEPTGQLGQEYQRLQTLKNSGKKYDKEIRDAYREIQSVRSTVALIEAEDGSNKKTIEDRFAAIQAIAAGLGEEQAKQINKIFTESVKGVPQRRSISYELLPNGSVELTARNANGSSYTIPLQQHQAQILAPSLLQSDSNVVMTKLLNANRIYRGAPSITGQGGQGAFRPDVSNLKNYKLRYQVKDDGEGNFTPIIEYNKSGTSEWRSLGNASYFQSLDQVRTHVNKIAQFDDAIFESKYLK